MPTQNKTPFAASPLGIAINTFLGLPKATVQVGKEIGQSIAQNIASAGLSLVKPLGGDEELAKENIKSVFGQEVFQKVLGNKPIKAVEDRIAEAELQIKESPLAQDLGLDKKALPLAFTGIIGTTVLDLTPFGGVQKNALKRIVEETTEKGATKIALQLGVDDQIAKQIAPIFVASKNEKDAIRAMTVLKSLNDAKFFAKKEAEKAVKFSPKEQRLFEAVQEQVALRTGVPKEQIDLASITKATRVVETEIPRVSELEARTLQQSADISLTQANQIEDLGAFSLPKSIQAEVTPVKEKVNLLDYLRTPDRVLAKIGLKEEADYTRSQYEGYLKELPKQIETIRDWRKQLPAESSERLFRWLDGQAVALTPKEKKVGKEIKDYLADWADRLDLPEDGRIAEYITHIFDKQLLAKEFDEDLAKIIVDKIPKSVYDPFLQKRLGAKGYIEDVWKALDAYVKRATRKVYLDPALEKISEKAGGLELSQWNYVKKYIDNVNMRPSDLDTLLDNGIKSILGYRFGQRPTTVITQFLRQMTYRAKLGLNISSALKNLSQGINTYSKLGEKYTIIGYSKLFSPEAQKELVEQGVLQQPFIQDQIVSATKQVLEKIDKGLWFFFQTAEKINRGAAYFGAKSKALAKGKGEEEAIEFAKKIVRDTQFTFGSIDTPVALQSDIAKTIAQFQTFSIKQIEFLTEMAQQKEFVGLLRYAISGMAFVYTIGQAFGMEPKDLIPAWRIGTPPSLKLPVETGKAILGAPDKYGQDRTIGEKAVDVLKELRGFIPAETQLKKTIQGIEAVRKGESQSKAGRTQFKVGGTLPKDIQAFLFGKYANQEAREYFNPKKKKETTLTF